MAVFDEDGARKKLAHEVGEDLSAMSLDELQNRVVLLKSEIDRIENVIATKRKSADAAAAFFRK